jgi:c-di-GMP-binding flagellar brake protein YcgR
MPLYRQFADAWRRHGPTDLEIWLSLLFVFGLLAFLLVRSMWDTKRIEGQQRRGALSRLLAAAREKGLLPEEIDFILNQAKAFSMEIDTSLVQSNVLFNQLAVNILKSSSQTDLPNLNETITLLRSKLGFKPPPRGLALVSTRELPASQMVYLVFTTTLFLEATVRRADELNFEVRLQAGNPRAVVSPGTEVYVFFNRSGDARYAGPCKILSTTSDESGSFVLLSHCDELNRDQRRQDFRIEENRTISIWVMDQYLEESEEPLEEVKDRMPERAVLEDLSGGGASVIYHRKLAVNQGIIIDLDPSNILSLPLLRGTVLRSARRGRVDRWALSVRFEDLRPSEHQKLVGYVFLKERDLLKIA